MSIYEVVMLLAVFLSPIFAVGVTLLIEHRRRSKESKLHIVKMLMSSRHLVGDAMYSAAINLIPIEFHSDVKVIKAYNAYVDIVKLTPSEENKAILDKELEAKQLALIHSVLKCTGFDIPESKLMTDAYAASAFIFRDNLYLESLQATISIANSIKEQTDILKSN